MTPPPKDELMTRLDSLADDCITEYPNRTMDAIDAMEHRVRSDARYREAIFEVMVREACSQRIRQRISRRNGEIWREGVRANEIKYDPSQRGDRLRRAAETSNVIRLMDYQLAGGLTLAQARKSDIQKNIEIQLRQGIRMVRTGNWLRMIYDSLPDDKTKVGDSFTEDELLQMQHIVMKAIKDPTIPPREEDGTSTEEDGVA